MKLDERRARLREQELLLDRQQRALAALTPNPRDYRTSDDFYRARGVFDDEAAGLARRRAALTREILDANRQYIRRQHGAEGVREDGLERGKPDGAPSATATLDRAAVRPNDAPEAVGQPAGAVAVTLLDHPTEREIALGTFDFVQLTGHLLRVGPDGDFVGHFDERTCDWVLSPDEAASRRYPVLAALRGQRFGDVVVGPST